MRRGKNKVLLPDNSDKNTDAHLKYVIHISLPLQQWLRERASILRYMYNACLISLHTGWEGSVRTTVRPHKKDHINLSVGKPVDPEPVHKQWQRKGILSFALNRIFVFHVLT